MLFALSMIVGIVISYYLKNALILILPLVSCAFFLVFAKLKFQNKTLILITFIFFVIGCVEFRFFDYDISQKFNGYSGQTVIVYGSISSEPEIKEGRVSYVVSVYAIMQKKIMKKINGKILLKLKTDIDDNMLDYGTEIKVMGSLQTAQGSRNPGGFDYKHYLAGKEVSAIVYSHCKTVTILNYEGSNKISRLGIFIKQNIISTIDKSIVGKEQAGLLNGMLIGARNGLDKSVQNAFSDAGLTHIMAVSGMNVAFVVFPFVFLFKKIRLKKITSNIIIIAILGLFSLVTGFTPSVMRAVIMAVLVLISQIVMRDPDVISGLSFSAIIILIFGPNILFDIGFQLSYVATLSIVLLYKKIKSVLDKKIKFKMLTDVISLTVAAQIGTIPIIALYFNKISLISLISNIFVVPVVEIITILGFCMAIIGQISIHVSQLLGYINYLFLSFVLIVTKISAAIPFATIKISTPPIIIIILYYLSLIFFYFQQPKLKKIFNCKNGFIIFVCILLISIVSGFIPRGLEIIFIDVGEGDSALIMSESGKTVLIDGGDSFDSADDSSNAGELIVAPLLYDYNISRIDIVVATHAHDDHIKGLIPIIKQFEIGMIVLPESGQEESFSEILDIAELRKITVLKCEKNDNIKIDKNTMLEAIYPKQGFTPQTSALNNGSLVLKLLYKSLSVLFTGDIEEEVEKMLIDDGVNLNADIVKIAHHGSGTSSTEEFLDKVNPYAAVVSVGTNSFGHPSKEVLERLKENNIITLRTDQCGAVIMNSDGKTISLKRFIGE